MKNKLLIIGYVWPEPKSSAAGSRMLQLINVFLSDNYDITFASPCAKTDNAYDLREIGVEQVNIELNDSSFDDFVKVLSPNIVLFDRFMMEEQFGWRIVQHCPEALRILDTEDLHCLRKGRHQALKAAKPFDDSYLFNDLAKREIASIYRCDLSLIISEAEMLILEQKFRVSPEILVYLPFLLKEIDNEHIKDLPVYGERQHFVTIGNFLHAPNYDAVLYLKHTIWPLIKAKLPHAELHVYGAYATEKVLQLHNANKGFIVKGFAEDVNEVMKTARVCLAPLRFGAGLKGKLVDAMCNGTPVVTSNIGAEGLFGDVPPNGIIADDPNEIANASIALYLDGRMWKAFQANGFKVINTRFQYSNFANRLSELVTQIRTDLHGHRLKNFTGQMLLHHSLQSTKYLSKWIEEKNKS